MAIVISFVTNRISDTILPQMFPIVTINDISVMEVWIVDELLLFAVLFIQNTSSLCIVQYGDEKDQQILCECSFLLFYFLVHIL